MLASSLSGAVCVCTNCVGGEKRGCEVEIISRLVASLCRSAAAAGIKYSDTGAVPECLIEVPALPNEITGGAAGTAVRFRRGDVPTNPPLAKAPYAERRQHGSVIPMLSF